MVIGTATADTVKVCSKKSCAGNPLPSPKVPLPSV